MVYLLFGMKWLRFGCSWVAIWLQYDLPFFHVLAARFDGGQPAVLDQSFG